MSEFEDPKKEIEMWQKFYNRAKKHVEETIPQQIKELNEEFILNKAIKEQASNKLKSLKNKNE